MRVQRRNKIILISMVFMTILLGQLTEVRNSNGLLIAAIILTCAYAFVCRTEQLMYLALLLVASNRLLTIGSISAPAMVMLIGSIRAIENGTIRIRIGTLTSALCLLFLSSVTIINGNSQLISTIKILIVLFFVKNSLEAENFKQKYVEYIEFCCFGCILTSALALIFNPRSLIESARFSLTGSGGENALGIMAAVMLLNLFLILMNKENNHRQVHIIFSLLLLGICLITGSRTAALCLVVGLAGMFAVYLFKFQVKQLITFLFYSAIVAAIICVLLKGDNIVTSYVNRFLYRLRKYARTDISNGRFELWKLYIEALKANPRFLLFGGMDYRRFAIEKVAHNAILEQVTDYGIVGTVVTFILYIYTYKDILYANRARVRLLSANIMPLVALLIGSMFSHTLTGIPQTMMLFMSAYGLMEARQ